MPPVTTIRSTGALVLGAIFALGTAATLFWDVRSFADVTIDHMMTALVLIGTIASGHMVWRQARGWHILPCLGLGVLFCGGTFYCVTTSASRNVEVEVGIPKLLATLDLNEQRKRLETDIAEAKSDARKAKATAAKNCTDGEGPGCRALTKLADAAESHYWVLVARLAGTQPEQSANPGLHHAAQVFAALPFAGSAGSIEHGLVLFSPFVKALFLEIATVVFFGIGLGHRSFNKAEALLKVAPVSFPKNRSATVSETEIVLEALRRARSPVSNDELAMLMRVSKAEASRRATIALDAGLITRERSGREVAISLAARKLN